MFNNRSLNIALAISFTWHVFCMSAFNIVVLPGKYAARDLTSVSFLGPILGNTALDIILANKPVAVTTIYRRERRYRHVVEMREERFLGDKAKKHISDYAEKSISKALNTLFRKDKEVPSIAKADVQKKIYPKTGDRIEGAVAEREVIYKPKRPEVPWWITTNEPFNLELEFFVSGQGEVKEVIPVISSGNADVDLLGIRYLKGWRFAPLAKGQDAAEKGRISFSLGGQK